MLETETKTYTEPDGIEVTYGDLIEKRYEGEWNFEFDIDIDNSKTDIVQVNETNENGLGIAKVVLLSNSWTKELYLVWK